jgi:hypothetical protein
MLHIITPLYRYDFLPNLYQSIFDESDIIWHISKSNLRESLDFEFLKNNPNIKIYNVECEDSDTTSKRNAALSQIKDGYFCFLDDDTLFHENMYYKYLELSENNFKGMLIGEQIDTDGELRLIASYPVYRHIDTGNVISHHSCLKDCQWPSTHTPGVNQKDFLFWNSVYEFYGKKCAIWNQPISYYNKLKSIKNDKPKKNIITYSR